MYVCCSYLSVRESRRGNGNRQQSVSLTNLTLNSEEQFGAYQRGKVSTKLKKIKAQSVARGDKCYVLNAASVFSIV